MGRNNETQLQVSEIWVVEFFFLNMSDSAYECLTTDNGLMHMMHCKLYHIIVHVLSDYYDYYNIQCHCTAIV